MPKVEKPVHGSRCRESRKPKNERYRVEEGQVLKVEKSVHGARFTAQGTREKENRKRTELGWRRKCQRL